MPSASRNARTNSPCPSSPTRETIAVRTPRRASPVDEVAGEAAHVARVVAHVAQRRPQFVGIQIDPDPPEDEPPRSTQPVLDARAVALVGGAHDGHVVDGDRDAVLLDHRPDVERPHLGQREESPRSGTTPAPNSQKIPSGHASSMSTSPACSRASTRAVDVLQMQVADPVDVPLGERERVAAADDAVARVDAEPEPGRACEQLLDLVLRLDVRRGVRVQRDVEPAARDEAGGVQQPFCGPVEGVRVPARRAPALRRCRPPAPARGSPCRPGAGCRRPSPRAPRRSGRARADPPRSPPHRRAGAAGRSRSARRRSVPPSRPRPRRSARNTRAGRSRSPCTPCRRSSRGTSRARSGRAGRSSSPRSPRRPEQWRF